MEMRCLRLRDAACHTVVKPDVKQPHLWNGMGQEGFRPATVREIWILQTAKTPIRPADGCFIAQKAGGCGE